MSPAVRTALFALAGAVLLAGLFLVMRPQPAPAPVAAAAPLAATAPAAAPEPRPAGDAPLQFELLVRDRKLAGGPHTLSVVEGQSVIINLTADVEDELHLHGYDLKAQLHPGQRASLVFAATRSGRFEYELEKSGVELGVLEVMPR